jgi:hypothetical protein
MSILNKMAGKKNSIQQINKKLNNLWIDNSFTKLVPMFYPDPSDDSILFVGINPSYNEKAIMKDTKGGPYEFRTLEEINEFYKFHPIETINRISKLQAIQKIHREQLPYFNRHRNLSEKLGNHTWEQIDLFQIRESIQIKLLNDINLVDPFFVNRQIFFLNC